jgi:DNA-binding transcriptional MerR regulator
MDQQITETEVFNLEKEFERIPDQMAFKIGDVADLLGVKAYVLRYWEQEFKSLNPKKALNNQRIYSRRDVETVILIKKFLYVDQFSIPGARKALKEYRDQQSQFNNLMKEQKVPSTVTSTAIDPSRTISLDSTELLTEKYIKLEESINQLISKIKSVRGKLEHRFHQIGL